MEHDPNLLAGKKWNWIIKLILLWDMILKTTEPGGALVDQSQIYNIFHLEFRPEMRPAMRCHTVIHPVQLRVHEDFYC